MQKLRVGIRFKYGDDRGSTLIIAIVMAIIMAIGGIGFLVLATNTLNNESGAYNNDKAFHAAESGALLTYRWLKNAGPAKWTNGDWNSSKTNFQELSINGLEIDVDVTFPMANRQAEIRAVAYSDSTRNANSFRKRIVITASAW
jgi:hypothetical protein